MVYNIAEKIKSFFALFIVAKIIYNKVFPIATIDIMSLPG